MEQTALDVVRNDEAQRKKKFNKTKDQIENFLITMWPMVGFLLFGAIPLVLSIYMSFTELHTPIVSDAVWVGFDNYVAIITNTVGKIYHGYLTTFILLISVPISLALGLYIAYLVNKITKGQKFLRSVFFIPYMCSSVIIAMAFKLLYGEDSGVLNVALQSLGFAKYSWLRKDAFSFLLSSILMSVWSSIGFCTVLFSAALSNVDKTYYEAAEVDGASSFVIFWKITFPAISPTLGYLITIRLISGMQAMEATMVLAGGSSGSGAFVPQYAGTKANAPDTIVYRLYFMAFISPYELGYGLASACAWVLAIIIFIITRINFALQRRWVSYDF